MIPKTLNTVVFYTCGVCNLQCRYCGIDKNPILKEIDKALGESFNGDYYFEKVKKYFPNRGQLKRIETWGGEPFLKMDRLYPTLHKIINHYYYFNEMFSSTNFSYPQWIDQFFGLMDQLGQYPDRDFTYFLQLSVDGPEYINDAGRGIGVTSKCLENYNKLLTECQNGRLPDNVNLEISLKATLDNESIRNLNNKQKLIEYFQFFEDNFYEPYIKIADNIKNVSVGLAHPNTAVPSPVTVEEGRIFAEVCKKCREIEQENIDNNYFKYYKIITFFDVDITQDVLTYKYSHHTCGTGTVMVGIMPDDMISTCHEGFTQFAEEYKKLAAQSDRVEKSTITFDKFLMDQTLPYCVKDEQYLEHCRKMMMFNNQDTTARLATMTTQIVSLAMSGQIESCYLNHANALKAAMFIQCHTAFCIKDNYNKTGSFTMVPNGLLKLLLNGAMQYIQHDGELRVEECNYGEYCGFCNGCR